MGGGGDLIWKRVSQEGENKNAVSMWGQVRFDLSPDPSSGWAGGILFHTILINL